MTSPRIRVSAVVRRGNTILLVNHQKENSNYWLLPGGGVRAGETAEEALAREVLEETSMVIKPGPIIGICESIWPDRSRHVVHFIYDTQAASGSPGTSSDPRVRGSRFVEIDSLENLTLHPPLQTWLAKRFAGEFMPSPQYLGPLWD
ncbi:MAG: NUDIX hydrolase [Candidatus Abyssubacteria bacterium]